MIGVMIPGVFAEKVSNYIGSAIIDENSYRFTHGGSIGVTVYGSVNCDDCVYEGEIYVHGTTTTSSTIFLVEDDGSFTREILCCNADGVYNIFVSYRGNDIGVLQINPQQYFKDQKAAAEQKASEEQRAAEWKAAEKKAAEQKAAEQRAAEKKAAEQRAVAAKLQAQADEWKAEQRAAAAEQRAAEARAEAAIRAAEAKAAQDLTNFLIIGGIAIMIISLVVMLAKRKNKKSSAPPRSTTRPTPPPTPPPSPSGNTETSTMFFYECPKCHSGDIKNNPDGSVNCPSCGYRG